MGRTPEDLVPLLSLTPGKAHRTASLTYQQRNIEEGKMLRLPHAARTDQRALLRKASRRVPESSTCSSEETQQAAAWSSAGNSRCA
jgi:hypothetical protein